MEDWMTGTEVARSRGICELSKGGNQAIETRRIPLFQKDDGYRAWCSLECWSR